MLAIRRLSAVGGCLLGLALVPGSGHAEDPPFVPFTSALPALPAAYSDSVFDACADGASTCVDATLDEMYRRYGELLAADCDHNAVFALTYIRVTEIYKERAASFNEDEYLAHEDAVFAQMYFDAFDAWAGGAPAPEAWQIAFGSGHDRVMPAIGNILLGINAHVNRDMPYLLEGLGLAGPEGQQRKADHDRFNAYLNEVYDDVITEMTRRFDPATDDFNVPGTTLDDFVSFQILPVWREMVWRHAEMLDKAPTPEARHVVEDHIERYAAGQARFIRTMLGREGSSAARDAWCRTHAGTVEDARNRTYPIPG